MNKLGIFSILAGTAVLMTGIITGFQFLKVQEALAATNNCGQSVVTACVATGDILTRNKVAANICADVLTANSGACRIRSLQ